MLSYLLKIVKIKMILLILFLVVFVECKNFKMSTNICFPRAGKTIECHGEYNNNCNNFVCTKNKYTCQMLLFSLKTHLLFSHISAKTF